MESTIKNLNMKYRICAVLNLCVLVFYISIPAIPYIHYIAFKDFIVKNLCENMDKPEIGCQGKCYLNKQIKKSVDSGDEMNRTAGKKVQLNEVKDFLNTHITISIVDDINLKFYQTYSENIIPKMFPSDIFVPPKSA
jgi:hypothetical protein